MATVRYPSFVNKPKPVIKKPETTFWCNDYNRFVAQEVVDKIAYKYIQGE
jgi:hypothetical protein